MIEKARDIWQRLTQFLFHDLWDIEVTSLSALRQLPVRILRVAHLVIRGFREDELPIHASALTFVALMSFVPLLAIIFSVLKGFGVGQDSIAKVMEWRDAMPEQLQGFVDQMLEIANATNFAALGSIGVAFLLFTAIMVLGNIEISFNRVWRITKTRNMLRRTANYVFILVVVPLCISIAMTISAAFQSSQFVAKLGTARLLVRSLARLSPLLITWFAFSLLYLFLPNTRVRLRPAFLSGLVGALLWLGWQKLYITLQIGVARYNAIYGTFASVPIFLAWLYVSWIILLLGAELAFACQNHATYHLEQKADAASLRSRVSMATAVVIRAAEGLAEDKDSLELSSFARERRVSIRLLNEIVGLFVGAGWLAEVAEQPGCYVLLKAPERIKAKDIVDVVVSTGASPEGLGLDHLGPSVESLVRKIDEGLDMAFQEQTVQDLLNARG